MDWPLIISSTAAGIAAITGIYVAISTRKKNEGDAALAISQAAENIVIMREKDTEVLNKKILLLEMRLNNQEEYITYLQRWIGRHSRATEKPMTYTKFLESKGKTP